jgi:hypothetical protein
MRSYHACLVSAALLGVALGAMDFLHGGWDAVAGGLALLSAMACPLAFAVLAGKAEQTAGARDGARGPRPPYQG